MRFGVEPTNSTTFWRRPSLTPAIRLAAGGDLSLSGLVGEKLAAERRVSPLEGIEPLLSSCQLAFANLESVLLDEHRPGQQFAAPASAVGFIEAAGITHLSLANNHILDHGVEGLSQTLSALAPSSIRPLGAALCQKQASEVLIEEIDGIRLGWLANARTLLRQQANRPGFWEFDETELLEAVRLSTPRVDVLIVSIHTGFMLVEYPSPELRTYAHRLCDAGAHLVLMHHPHVLQGVAIVGKNKVVCYSLGNLLFDWREGRVQTRAMIEQQNEGGLFLVDLDRNGIAGICFVPTVIEDRQRVKIASEDDAQRIRRRLDRLSEALRTDYTASFERQRAAHNTGLALRTVWAHLCRGELRKTAQLLSRIRPSHLRMLLRWISYRGSAPRPS